MKVRQLYLSAFSLLIDFEILEEFKCISSLMCMIGLHEHQDTILGNGRNVLDTRRELKRRIGARNYDETDIEQLEREEMLYAEDEMEKECSERSRVRSWVDNVHKKALDVRQLGCDPNSFYFKDLIEGLIPLIYEFCLWTAISLPFFRGHSTVAMLKATSQI